MAEKSTATPVAPDSSFDWVRYADKGNVYSSSEKETLDKMYDDTLSTVTEKAVTEGTVVAITKKEVVINIGYKSEGVVPLSEFRYNPNMKPGEKVVVFVESTEDKNGQLIISHKKARMFHAWERVNEALNKDEVITGFVKCRTKGGLIVDVFRT
jgi:small subunit ribosomal protein S1